MINRDQKFLLIGFLTGNYPEGSYNQRNISALIRKGYLSVKRISHTSPKRNYFTITPLGYQVAIRCMTNDIQTTIPHSYVLQPSNKKYGKPKHNSWKMDKYGQYNLYTKQELQKGRLL